MSFESRPGYPWTQLGYTYDWGNSNDHYGLTEYTIIEGAPVHVLTCVDIEHYCWLD